MTDIEDIAKKYNKNIMKLIDIIEMNIKDPLVDLVKREVRLGITTDRTFMLSESGHYIYKYRYLIFNDQWDELIQEVKKMDDLNNNNEFKKIFNLLFGLWSKFNNNEKNVVTKLIKLLLSDYSKYLLLIKN